MYTKLKPKSGYVTIYTEDWQTFKNLYRWAQLSLIIKALRKGNLTFSNQIEETFRGKKIF